MARRYVAKRIKCPFWVESRRRAICCESLMSPPLVGERHEFIEGEPHPFATEGERARHEDEHCCAEFGYRFCPIYRAIMKTKYGGGD